MRFYLDCFFTFLYYTGVIVCSLLWFLIKIFDLDSSWFLLLNTLTAVYIYITARYKLFGYGYSFYYLLDFLIIIYNLIPSWYFIKYILPITTHISQISYQAMCMFSSIIYTFIIFMILQFYKSSKSKHILTTSGNKKKK